MMFGNDKRSEIVAVHFDGMKISNSSSQKKAKEIWDEMSEEERKPWTERHAVEWSAYKANPRSTKKERSVVPHVRHRPQDGLKKDGTPDLRTTKGRMQQGVVVSGPSEEELAKIQTEMFGAETEEESSDGVVIDEKVVVPDESGMTGDKEKSLACTITIKIDVLEGKVKTHKKKLAEETLEHEQYKLQHEESRKAIARLREELKQEEERESDFQRKMADVQGNVQKQTDKVTKYEKKLGDLRTLVEDSDSDSDEEDDEEVMEVVTWDYKGKTYLLHEETGEVYDYDSQEKIGRKTDKGKLKLDK